MGFVLVVWSLHMKSRQPTTTEVLLVMGILKPSTCSEYIIFQVELTKREKH